MPLTIENVPERMRYEARRDGQLVGWIDHVHAGPDTVLTHAEVLRAERGNGVGSEMVAGVVEQLRHEGKRVVAGCSFVAMWLRAHAPADAEADQRI